MTMEAYAERIERIYEAYETLEMAAKKGKDSPWWKGGKQSEMERLRHQAKWKIWRETIFLRDNFTCQSNIKTKEGCEYCGNRRGVTLHPHHILPKSFYPELMFDINNGITFCAEYHLKSGLHKNVKRRRKL